MVVVEAIVGAVLSAYLQVQFDRLSPRTNLIEFFRRHEFNKILLEDLETAMLQVNAVLSDAEEKQITNQFVRKWVDKLKDAAYHTADLLDEINSLASASKSQEKGKSKLDKRIKELKSNLEKMTLKLQNIVKYKEVLGLKESHSGKPFQRLQSTSLVEESKVYGRENDKEKILNFLLSDNNADGQDIPVVAIIGVAGVGKTTLAQLLYNDSDVQKHFPKRAWVYVSEDFDVFKVTKALYESVTLHQCDITDLNILQVRLKEKLTGEKFLFILDDVWNEYYSKWDVLQNFLIAGAPESRIIVTTRSQGVASTMRATHSYHLRPLGDIDCWSVFANHAFGSSLAHAPSNLTSIGQEIMEKCRGLPLAAKVLGSLLYSKVEAHEWKNVLNSNIWDLPNDKSDILPSLRMSYCYLPSPLKQCFAYCSIFPKGYKFDKERLVLLWMAEGFLQQPRSDRTMEEVGIEYFHELLSRSFFQQANDDNNPCFEMHDLINELAQFASSESCFKYEKGKSHSISGKARHFSYVIDQFEDSAPEISLTLREAKYLRTFLPLSLPSSSRSRINKMVVDKLLPEQKRLRVLSLSHYSEINSLPAGFKRLLHLRYLDFSHNAIEKLPNSIDCLYNLQTLILSHCIHLIELPAKMGNLIKLGHLDLNGTNSLKRMPVKFGGLKSLQVLTTFVVSNSTEGSSISELGGLELLRGKLSILQLQNVTVVEEAEDAKLKDKENIKEVEFNWNCDYGHLNHETVLEKLRPHENIEKLSIVGYGGSRLPDWLGDSSFFTMVILQLTDCNCSSLPSLGQLPSLQELHVQNLPVLESIGVDFYGNGYSSFSSLRTLKFYYMPRWEEWSVPLGEGFPLLQNLHIRKCENLSRIPNCFPCLEELVIYECSRLEPVHIRICNHLEKFTSNFSGMLKILEIQECRDLRIINISRDFQEDLNFLQELKISECPSLESFSGGGLPAPNLTTFSVSNCNKLKLMPEQMHTLSSLQTLNISGCPEIESLPDGGLPPSLQTLIIQNCVNLNLTPLDAWGLRNMTSLTRLTIECENANVASFPDEGLLPASLTSLEISGFRVLENLYLRGLQHLILLTDLHINCSRLQTFSDGMLPSSLSSLRISGCSSLTDLCQEDQGFRHKISHIPFKVINGIEIN